MKFNEPYDSKDLKMSQCVNKEHYWQQRAEKAEAEEERLNKNLTEINDGMWVKAADHHKAVGELQEKVERMNVILRNYEICSECGEDLFETCECGEDQA